MRRLTTALLALSLLVAAPQSAGAQLPVTDGANLAARLVEYAMQGLQYAEQIASAASLAEQVTQLDDQIEHLRDAANGRVAALSQAFAQLSSDPASLLRDGGVNWTGRLSGDSPGLVQALLQMDGSSLVDHLQGELDAADAVGETDLLNLYPGDPNRGTRLAGQWRTRREAGDRIRAADFASAEAAGRIATLLDNAQQRLAGRRAQAQLSNTALQQAMVANQLTAAEVDLGLAQLLAIQAQQEALQRHEAELIERERLQQWVQRERDRLASLQALQAAEENRRAANRTFLLLPTRHGN